MELTEMSATRMAAEIRSGAITAEQVIKACLNKIACTEEAVQAWSFLDPDYALDQARAADQTRKQARSLGSLHGVPIGVKDIIDTADMPTENGTILHAGRQPTEDAAVVSLLRSAGAIIIGKTVTTELAVYTPGKTRNPHNPEHTPGGSSSGSAAAVAAGMVPLAVGTQTNGSVIRPASYCGVVAFKPTHGSISRYGVLRQSLHLDQMGVFARTVEDVALISEELMVFDSRDPSMKPFARPPLCRFTNQEPPTPCRIAFVKSPVWEQTEEDTRSAFADLIENLGSYIEEVRLPVVFDEGVELHRIIWEADLAVSFSTEYDRGAAQLSSRLRKMIESGQKVLAAEYTRALAKVPTLIACLEEIFRRYDAILTPSTTGEAPKGLQSTGSPIFCTLWTLCGVPAVNLPLLKGANGLPIGVQLVGRRHNEGHLLRTAKWIMDNWESEEKRDKH